MYSLHKQPSTVTYRQKQIMTKINHVDVKPNQTKKFNTIKNN